MTRNEPPRMATWVLEHFVPGARDEGLAGDLCEEFHSGRSTSWYWRQVSSAMVIGMHRAAGDLGAPALFAFLWSMLAPAWLLMVARMEKDADLSRRFYQMDWPWSTVCELGMLLLADVAFIGLGIMLYQVPHLFRPGGFGVRQISRSAAASIPVLIVLSAALIAVPEYFINLHTAGRQTLGPVSSYAITRLNPPEVRRLARQEEWSAQYGERMIEPGFGLISAITDVRLSTLLVRLPFFLAVLCALWRVTRLEENEPERIRA